MVGNVQKLIPFVFNKISEENLFNENEIAEILLNWNYFSSKEDYYNFRSQWNNKYFNDTIDKFILETAML